jgi:ATP-dependent RNA helicase DDX24/MAK5
MSNQLLTEPKTKAEAIKNWTQFEVCQELADSLVANNFRKPTIVQAQTLVHLQSHVDMIVAAKTGQGKTLCFGIPIIDIVIRRIEKNQGEDVDRIAGLVIAPTRELAIQIKDHLTAVVPSQYEQQIRICAIVGGMSVDKQLRLLKYKPTIIVATPGRLWEMMTEYSNRYLLECLPMIDVIVLDEADRLISDGHFKEMADILAHIYTQRLKIKTKKPKAEIEEALPEKDAIESGGFEVGKTMTSTREDIDWSKIKDLYDDDEIMGDMVKEGIETEEKPSKDDKK